jgi:hypothetical protein
MVIWQIRQRGFLRFEPEPFAAEVEADPLPFPDTINLRASGSFAVSGMQRYFVEAAAQYQTFHTRERVVMANIPRTSFLFLINSPEAEVGWWYIFFTPKIIQTIEPGILRHGRQTRIALGLTYLPDGTEVAKTLYLTFDTPQARMRVLADLKVDQRH